MKKIFIFLVLFSLVTLVKAQDYKNAIGIRAGYPTGITFKHFMGGGPRAFEGIFSFYRYGFSATALIEKHSASAFDVPRLNWYYGGGGHIGTFNDYPYRYYRKYKDYVPGDRYLSLGVDGIIGIEYNLKEIPINFSLDLKPSINLFAYPDFWIDPGLSIRYCF